MSTMSGFTQLSINELTIGTHNILNYGPFNSIYRGISVKFGWGHIKRQNKKICYQLCITLAALSFLQKCG